MSSLFYLLPRHKKILAFLETTNKILTVFSINFCPPWFLKLDDRCFQRKSIASLKICELQDMKYEELYFLDIQYFYVWVNHFLERINHKRRAPPLQTSFRFSVWWRRFRKRSSFKLETLVTNLFLTFALDSFEKSFKSKLLGFYHFLWKYQTIKRILFWRCPWCNGCRRRKWTRRHEFKYWTRLIAFSHIIH